MQQGSIYDNAAMIRAGLQTCDTVVVMGTSLPDVEVRATPLVSHRATILTQHHHCQRLNDGLSEQHQHHHQGTADLLCCYPGTHVPYSDVQMSLQRDTMLVNCLARLRVLRSHANAAAADNEAKIQPPPPLRVVSCIRTTHTYLAAADIARRSTAAGDLMAVDLITTSQLTGGYMTQVRRHHGVVISVDGGEKDGITGGLGGGGGGG